MKFDLVTYNIHKAMGPGGNENHLLKIRDALRNYHPDIVCLQEVHGERTSLSFDSTMKSLKRQDSEREVRTHVDILASRYWEHSHYAKNADGHFGDHGNAILSKYAFKEVENINVSFSPRASRSLLHARIELPNTSRPLHVICIHLGLLEIERAKQIEKLCQRIKEHVPHEEPLIIAGDTNDWRGRMESLFTAELDLQEVYQSLTGKHARTFPASVPLLPLDRIYYRGLIPLDVDHHVWPVLSDHRPIGARFELA